MDRSPRREHVAPLRLGVAGAGWWATTAHLPAAAADPRVELVAVADAHAPNAAAARERFGAARWHTTAEDLVEAGGLDALVVATPHATHHAIARMALLAGLHVLVEKPLTLTAGEALDLHARAREAGLTLATGYTYHFAQAAQHARAALADIGEVELVSVLFASSLSQFLHLDADPADAADGPRASTYADSALAGGGQGQTQVTHAAEMALWMTRLRPRRVAALMRAIDAAVDEVDALTVELENGALATIASTGRQPRGGPTPQELRYCGTRGTLFQDLVAGACALHGAGGAPLRFASPDPYPLAGPLGGFVDAIRGAPSLAPAWSGVATAALLEAAYASARDGGRPVDIAAADLPAPD